MPRVGVTKKQVIEAANHLMDAHALPTAAGIREHLGTGSLTTIQKYFRQWKQSCFEKKSPIELKPASVDSSVKIPSQETLERLSKQKAILAKECIETEQEKARLNQENTLLNQNIDEITEQYKMLVIKHEALLEQHQNLLDERQYAIGQILLDKNKEINALKEELKLTNQASLSSIKEMGYSNDDAVMKQKVKLVHLQDQAKTLQKANQDLESQLDQEKQLTAPLKQKIQELNKFIKEVVSWEQMQAYSKRQQEQLTSSL